MAIIIIKKARVVTKYHLQVHPGAMLHYVEMYMSEGNVLCTLYHHCGILALNAGASKCEHHTLNFSSIVSSSGCNY